ncbi:PD40 domain-containing protein [Saccharothrix sp. 6-C]|uniref:NB-ARC domain-containing protein n=1 Tax=Saccharothrix sp. 6-C TaxID=2781735 RepID=UPI001916F4FE|nr:NB-ARC domain-containing protein [Saccharothrix sp. 6-C]QQQ75756.1 PD40 domain-containing protein [Saccharothrix sp. 6-C]
MISIVVAALLNLATGGLVSGSLRWILGAGVLLLGFLWVALEYVGSSVGAVRGHKHSPQVWMLPKLDESVDRPALRNALVRMLVSNRHELIGLTALQGAGGFGKTTLAVQVCGRPEVRKIFTGGLLWATVGEERHGAELASIVNDLSAQLTGERPQFSDPEQAGLHLGRLLDERANILLVLDDVWTAEQYKAFSYGGSTTTRLVTTRNVGCLPAGARMLRIDEMASAESVELLSRGLVDLPAGITDRLLHVTGNWPLLLAMVNGAILGHVRDGSAPADAAALLAQQLEVEGPSVLDVRIGASRDHAVRLTVAASLRLLTPWQRKCYLQLGIFAEDTDIPLSILSVLWGETAAETRQLCEDLANLSLIRAYERGSATLQLHDVIRDHLRHELGDDLAEVNSTFLKALRSVYSISGDEWWNLPPSAGYLRRQLAYHLTEARQFEQLRNLVCDLRWGAEKIRALGLPALEADLVRVDDPTATAMRLALVRKGHLLGAIEPVHSHDDLLVSRLGSVPELRQVVADFATRLSTNVARIANRWPIPAVDPALLRVLPARTDGTSRCAVSPDGRLLAVTGAGGVQVWRTDSWVGHVALQSTGGTAQSCAFSADGRWLATAGADGVVRVWDTLTWSEVGALRGHAAAVLDCVWSPDGRWLAAAGGDQVHVWQAGDWTGHAVLEDHVGAITGCAFSPDGRRLASTGVDGSVRVWDTDWTDAVVLRGAGPMWGCEFSPDGRWLVAFGESGGQVWSVDTWTDDRLLANHAGRITGCAFAPDGVRLVTTGADRTIRVWNTASWAEEVVMRGHTEQVTSCVFAPGGRWLASAGDDHSVRVWDLSADGPRGGRYEQNRAVDQCLVSSDGTWLVAAGGDGVVCVWASHAPVRREVVAVHRGAVTCFALSSDGTRLLTAGGDGVLHEWRAPTWKGGPLLLERTAPLVSCGFSPDNTVLAGVTDDGRLRIWDAEGGRAVATVGAGMKWCLFSPDGVWLATGAASGELVVWNTRTWEPVTRLVAHPGDATCGAFSPDGAWLATVGTDALVRVWSTGDWSEAVVLPSTQGASGCAFSPDGRWLAVSSHEVAVRVWESVTWQLGAAMRTNGRANAVAWFPDGEAFCIGSSGGLYQFTFVPPAV